jgi:hypothetical protein
VHTLSQTLTTAQCDDLSFWIRYRHLESAIVYRGPSMFDRDSPIVAILTGIQGGSDNSKTGAKGRQLAQVYIIRADRDPLTAIRTGMDYAICQHCGLRGDHGKGRGCYVTIKNAPQSIYRAYARGSYAQLTPADAARLLRMHRVNLRQGAYGDPAALPIGVIRELAQGVRWTGYTHAWTTHPELRPYLMASVDSAPEARTAAGMGWRYFRTRTPDMPVLPGESMCPASAEMQHRSSCAQCLLCDGAYGADDRRRNITIQVHGSTATVHAVAFIRNKAALDARGAA